MLKRSETLSVPSTAYFFSGSDLRRAFRRGWLPALLLGLLGLAAGLINAYRFHPTQYMAKIILDLNAESIGPDAVRDYFNRAGDEIFDAIVARQDALAAKFAEHGIDKHQFRALSTGMMGESRVPLRVARNSSQDERMQLFISLPFSLADANLMEALINAVSKGITEFMRRADGKRTTEEGRLAAKAKINIGVEELSTVKMQQIALRSDFYRLMGVLAAETGVQEQKDRSVGRNSGSLEQQLMQSVSYLSEMLGRRNQMLSPLAKSTLDQLVSIVVREVLLEHSYTSMMSKRAESLSSSMQADLVARLEVSKKEPLRLHHRIMDGSTISAADIDEHRESVITIYALTGFMAGAIFGFLLICLQLLLSSDRHKLVVQA